jgi:hypothetical protein
MTPEMAINGGYTESGIKRQIGLENAVKYWPTPTVCGNYNRKGVSKTSGDGLATAVKMWPTPTCQDAEQAGSAKAKHLTLHRATQIFPTPGYNDFKSGTGYNHGDNKHTPQLRHLSGGQLNPTWVEWLMGWPLGWTDLKPLAMAKFREWQQQHGGY